MVTLYETLGVHEDASGEEIKRAYRKAAMRAHPDRNVGREAAAHDAFQEIKQAYAILSDPEQRRVYDAVYAEEMHKLRRREEEHAERARERYEKFVSQAMRYAERGHNRDVVFGVLLGRGCDEALAARIADGVAALCASRAQAASADTGGEPPGRADDRMPGSHPVAGGGPAQSAPVRERTDEHAQSEPLSHAGLFSTLWHGLFGLHS